MQLVISTIIQINIAERVYAISNFNNRSELTL